MSSASKDLASQCDLRSAPQPQKEKGQNWGKQHTSWFIEKMVRNLRKWKRIWLYHHQSCVPNIRALLGTSHQAGVALQSWGHRWLKPGALPALCSAGMGQEPSRGLQWV